MEYYKPCVLNNILYILSICFKKRRLLDNYEKEWAKKTQGSKFAV